MSEHRDSPSTGEAAMEVAGYAAGLGILTMALFPFSLVGLLLFIAPIAILIAPLVLIPILLLLLAAPFILLFRGVRSLMARRQSRHARRRRSAPDGRLTGRTAARPCP